MSLEPIRIARAPSSVRVVAGSALEAVEGIVHAELDHARAHGASVGRHEALSQGLQALDGALAQLDEVARSAKERVGEQALELTLEISRRLLRLEVDAGRYDLETIVREVLDESGTGRARCAVHLHPDDHARLEGAEFRAGTELVPDVAVSRGDVSVSTPDGVLVRDVERAIETIGERIRGELA